MSDLGAFEKPKLTVKIFGKEYAVSFTMRHYAVLQKKYGISPQELINNIVEKEDVESGIRLIWLGTLEFEDYSDDNPFGIKEEINFKDLYDLDLFAMKSILNQLLFALLGSLSQDDKKKANPSMQTKNISDSKNRSKNPKTKK